MLCEKCCKNENVYSFEAYEEYKIPAEYDFICVDCVEEYRMWKTLYLRIKKESE
ncbi:hypothetical protein Q8A72_06920 [Aeribacillus pallidus]|nr:hypothetical protein [Aeribacillus pallidus]